MSLKLGTVTIAGVTSPVEVALAGTSGTLNATQVELLRQNTTTISIDNVKYRLNFITADNNTRIYSQQDITDITNISCAVINVNMTTRLWVLVKKQMALKSNMTVQTTAPTEDITDGGVHLVYLDEEPATQYNGYTYFIKETI